MPYLKTETGNRRLNIVKTFVAMKDKCRNFCKQLTLPGRTVQQLPFFKTVRLYTVTIFQLLRDGQFY
jgi:hypothetical protein